MPKTSARYHLFRAYIIILYFFKVLAFFSTEFSNIGSIISLMVFTYSLLIFFKFDDIPVLEHPYRRVIPKLQFYDYLYNGSKTTSRKKI